MNETIIKHKYSPGDKAWFIVKALPDIGLKAQTVEGRVVSFNVTMYENQGFHEYEIRYSWRGDERLRTMNEGQLVHSEEEAAKYLWSGKDE